MKKRIFTALLICLLCACCITGTYFITAAHFQAMATTDPPSATNTDSSASHDPLITEPAPSNASDTGSITDTTADVSIDNPDVLRRAYNQQMTSLYPDLPAGILDDAELYTIDVLNDYDDVNLGTFVYFPDRICQYLDRQLVQEWPFQLQRFDGQLDERYARVFLDDDLQPQLYLVGEDSLLLMQPDGQITKIENLVEVYCNPSRERGNHESAKCLLLSPDHLSVVYLSLYHKPVCNLLIDDATDIVDAGLVGPAVAYQTSNGDTFIELAESYPNEFGDRAGTFEQLGQVGVAYLQKEWEVDLSWNNAPCISYFVASFQGPLYTIPTVG